MLTGFNFPSASSGNNSHFSLLKKAQNDSSLFSHSFSARLYDKDSFELKSLAEQSAYKPETQWQKKLVDKITLKHNISSRIYEHVS